MFTPLYLSTRSLLSDSVVVTRLPVRRKIVNTRNRHGVVNGKIRTIEATPGSIVYERTMRTKAKRPTAGGARARHGTGRHHERPGQLRARPAHRKKRVQASNSAPSLRVHIQPNGTGAQFWIGGQDGEAIVTSRVYPSSGAARQALIELIVALGQDDFESFDHT